MASPARTALCVVLVRRGRSEQGHDGVADELLHRAPAAFELPPEARVVGGEERLHVLGIELLRAGREADEVREQDGDDLALLQAGLFPLGKRRSAGAAEAESGRVVLAAGRTGRHVGRVRRARRAVRATS
jgi:hypothetical protein